MAKVHERWMRLSKKFDRLFGLPSPPPDTLIHARAVPARPTPAPATKTRRGRRPIHDWPLIERLDAEFCRTYRAETGRPPSWKERRAALAKKLGSDTLHLKTLQRRLPKLRS